MYGKEQKEAFIKEYLRNKVIALKNLSPNTSFIMEMQTVPN